MKPHPRTDEQDDLLRPRLTEMIDLRHALAKLEKLIDWEFFETEWASFFPATTGRPATSPRLVAGLLYLQHAYRLSDDAVVARWVENPYYQHFTGETFFRHCQPILEELNAAERVITDLQAKPTGKLMMTAPVTYGERIIAPVINDIAKAHPDLEIEVISTAMAAVNAIPAVIEAPAGVLGNPLAGPSIVTRQSRTITDW